MGRIAKVENDIQEQIIQSAVSVFAKHGYAKAKIEDIARKRNINVRDIYANFKSKQDVYQSVTKLSLSNIVNRQHICDDEGPLESVADVIKQLFWHFVENAESCRIVIWELSTGSHFEQNDIDRIFHCSRLEDGIRMAQARGTMKTDLSSDVTTSYCLQVLMQCVSMNFKSSTPEPESYWQKLEDNVTTVLVRGLK